MGHFDYVINLHNYNKINFKTTNPIYLKISIHIIHNAPNKELKIQEIGLKS